MTATKGWRYRQPRCRVCGSAAFFNGPNGDPLCVTHNQIAWGQQTIPLPPSPPPSPPPPPREIPEPGFTGTDVVFDIIIHAGPMSDTWVGPPNIYFYTVIFRVTEDPLHTPRAYHNLKTGTYPRPYRGPLPKAPFSFPPHAINLDQLGVEELLQQAIAKYHATKGISS